MKWEEFLKRVRNWPFIETSSLLLDSIAASSGKIDSLRLQLCRWEEKEKIHKLKKGIYVLAKEYRTENLNELLFASILKKPSYISLETALSYYGLIPEKTEKVISLTTKRQAEFNNIAGEFIYRHISEKYFWGYENIQINGINVSIAKPEKALLDYFYLNKISSSSLRSQVEELRIQNFDTIDLSVLLSFAKRFSKPGIIKSASALADFLKNEKKLYKEL